MLGESICGASRKVRVCNPTAHRAISRLLQAAARDAYGSGMNFLNPGKGLRVMVTMSIVHHLRSENAPSAR